MLYPQSLFVTDCSLERQPCPERYREYVVSKLNPGMLTDVILRPSTVMNGIRMVKLFGWEPKMREQLSDKRAEELRAIRKHKLLSLLNEVAKQDSTSCECGFNADVWCELA